jgi:2-polyprenyl-3-methyl-5-hydroxy-6-metoxy-1,4-benzoquinol methylase
MMSSTLLDAPPHTAADRPRLVACPVCHAGAFDALVEINGIPIETCKSCGLIAQNPQPSDAELAAIYGSDYFIGSSENDRFASQFEVVKRATAALQLDEIAAFLEQRELNAAGQRLLEVGCGHGNMLLEAQRRGYEVEGIEYSSDAAARANKKLGSDVVRVGAIGETPIPERTYDVCVLADVIEHVRDPDIFLRNMWKILKDGAVLFVATPSADSWSARILGRHWMEYKPEHLFYFNRATISRLLANAGFSDVTVSTGKKILTLDYVIGHFEKFPVPFISPSLRIARTLAPRALLGRPMKITASGINAMATKLASA